MMAHTFKDQFGEISIPISALWGQSTQRALESSPVIGRQFPNSFIRAISQIKQSAAFANGELGLLQREIASAIGVAASEIADGKHSDQFPLDIIQTGSGTSTNMNVNEVIANIANSSLGGNSCSWSPIHPNDHVNLGQSSNDVMPTALHIAAILNIRDNLIPKLEALHAELANKSDQFKSIPKIGRTHLMDALPMSLGQEFGGWAERITSAIAAIDSAKIAIESVALGATAIGTGFGAHPKFAELVCTDLNKRLGISIRPAHNLFEALASRSQIVILSAAIKAAAISLSRIADDMRLLASGPRAGIAELKLKALQAGSSIMPGKVNPTIPEIAVQSATQIIANDLAITLGANSGQLELNTHLPIIAMNLLEEISILGNTAQIFATRCIATIEADEERCMGECEKSLALATALSPLIGYDRASEIAQVAATTGKTIREVVLEQNIASAEEIDEIFKLLR